MTGFSANNGACTSAVPDGPARPAPPWKLGVSPAAMARGEGAA